MYFVVIAYLLIYLHIYLLNVIRWTLDQSQMSQSKAVLTRSFLRQKYKKALVAIPTLFYSKSNQMH
jgi:hypothetical protein